MLSRVSRSRPVLGASSVRRRWYLQGYGVVTVAAASSIGVGPSGRVDKHPPVPLRLPKPIGLVSRGRSGCPAPGRCHAPEEEATSGRTGRHLEGAAGFAAGTRGSRSSNWVFLNILGLASEVENGPDRTRISR